MYILDPSFPREKQRAACMQKGFYLYDPLAIQFTWCIWTCGCEKLKPAGSV